MFTPSRAWSWWSWPTRIRLRRASSAAALLALLAVAATLTALPREADALASGQPQHTTGYITMRDGVRLKYSLDLPGTGTTFPVALIYDVYAESAGALHGNDVRIANALLDDGFAVLGVNVRGTGCSEGTFDMRSPTESQDGAEVVEWAANESWSTGRVGMFGLSYPGLSQPRIAALRPDGLAAIAPFQIVDDVYRDVGYPGGIFNAEFASFWAMFDQPSTAQTANADGVAAGDTGCATADVLSAPGNAEANILLSGREHPYRDSFWEQKAIGASARRIGVPTLGCLAWQDDEVGSYPAASFFTKLDPRRTWVIASNGYHGMCDYGSTTVVDLTVKFFERYVAGRRNGFEAIPHVQVFHETRARQTDAGLDTAPRWVSTYAAWPPRVHARTLTLSAHGGLSSRLARAAGATSYRYPSVSAGTESGAIFGQRGLLWSKPFDTSGAAAFTTAKLSKPMEVFGPASLDLWFSSTATDTDLQATITEVRPDGQEMYVARGWLRASHRAVDHAASTGLLPVHPHTQDAARPLVPGRATKLRLAIFPFDHVFRAGSRLRVIVDTPSQTGGWNFDIITTPATSTILTGPEHPSALRLGMLPTPVDVPRYPVCGSILSQPCRTDPFGTAT